MTADVYDSVFLFEKSFDTPWALIVNMLGTHHERTTPKKLKNLGEGSLPVLVDWNKQRGDNSKY